MNIRKIKFILVGTIAAFSLAGMSSARKAKRMAHAACHRSDQRLLWCKNILKGDGHD